MDIDIIVKSFNANLDYVDNKNVEMQTLHQNKLKLLIYMIELIKNTLLPQTQNKQELIKLCVKLISFFESLHGSVQDLDVSAKICTIDEQKQNLNNENISDDSNSDDENDRKWQIYDSDAEDGDDLNIEDGKYSIGNTVITIDDGNDTADQNLSYLEINESLVEEFSDSDSSISEESEYDLSM
jgi:hypothetical protein